tara:strand:- start:150 stop:989 length:840 start_codon:yes stop_codon:yes gene_type:complete
MEKSTTGKEIATSVLGFITTIITVGICSWVEINWNFSIYTWMFFFIIPAGALCAGFAAASGYYFGAQVLHLPVSGRLTFNIVAASIAAFFLVYYIPYYFYESEGNLIRERIDFLTYLEIILTKTSYTFLRARTSTGEIGSWGYAIAFLQFLGFTLAGLAISQMLKEKPYCKDCSKYYSKKYEKNVFSSEGEKFLKNYLELATLMEQNLLNKIGPLHKKIGADNSSGHHLSIDFNILQCGCKSKNNYLSLSMSKFKGDEWEKIDNLSTAIITKEKIPLKY